MSYIPSKQEESDVANAIDEIVSFLDAEIANKHIPGFAMAAGSAAMNTFLAGDLDLDIFILSSDFETLFDIFSQYWPGFEKKGALLIWHVPNMPLVGKSYEVDLVFVDPKDPKTDTLSHVDHYKNLTDEQINEIRKAKALMKTFGAYAAELGGITGIALTELIVSYGNLQNGCRALMEGLDWLQDPAARSTDPERIRNLLASITKIKWKKVLAACSEYLRKGTFEYRMYTFNEFLEEYKDYVFVGFPRRMDKAIDYQRAMRSIRACVHWLNNIEKGCVKVDFEAFVDNYQVVIAFKADPPILPSERERRVSAGISPEHLRIFLEEHPDAKKVNDYYVLYEKREFTNVERFLENCIIQRWWRTDV